MMEAVVYLDKNHNMIFEAEDLKLKFSVALILEEIRQIVCYDKGLLTIETNYGEEYVDLPEIADELNLNINFEKYEVMLK